MDLSGQASARAHRFTNLVYLEVVDSTNTYVGSAFADGAGEGLVCVADEQLAGRGRRGRLWHSPAGSALLCSVLFQPSFAVERFHLLTSACALAARASIKQVAQVSVAIKWPNDLMIGSNKLGGILAELLSPVPPGRRPGLVVGLGLNLAWPIDYPSPDASPELRASLVHAVSLEQAGAVSFAREELLEVLLVELEARYVGLASDGGAKVLMAEYRAACSTIGQLVHLDLGESTTQATVRDVADDGRLVIEREGHIESIDTADVVHLRSVGPPP